MGRVIEIVPRTSSPKAAENLVAAATEPGYIAFAESTNGGFLARLLKGKLPQTNQPSNAASRIPRQQSNPADSRHSDLSEATHRSSSVARMPGSSRKLESKAAALSYSDLSGRIPRKKYENQRSSSQGPRVTSGQKRMQEVHDGTSSKRRRVQAGQEDTRNINHRRERFEINPDLGKSKKTAKRITPKIQANRQRILKLAAKLDARYKDMTYDQWLSQMLKTEKGLIIRPTRQFKELIISSYIRAKLEAETGFKSFIPWDDLAKYGITGWPSKIPITPIQQLRNKVPKLDSIIESLDEIEFKHQFLNVVKGEEQRKHLRDYLLKRREVVDHFAGLFPGSLTTNGVPWNEIDRQNIIGWPQDVVFKNPRYIKDREGFGKVYDAYKGMRFTEEFINEFDDSHFANRGARRRKNAVQGTSERAYLLKVLRQQLSKQIGEEIKSIQWKDTRKNDLINWPDEVIVKMPAKWSSNDQKSIAQVVDSITFSDSYVARIKKEKLASLRRATMSGERKKIQKEITDHIRSLQKEILKDTNHDANKVLWNEINHDYLLGWPTDLPISVKLDKKALLRISSRLKQLKFTDEFKEKYIHYLDYHRSV